jgi:predicted GIY-YIG superfamily endonuclease
LKHAATPKVSKAVVVRHNQILITVEKAVKETVKRAKDNLIELLREILDPMNTTLE